MGISIHISIAAAAIDQMNKSVIDRWFDYINHIDQTPPKIKKREKENETRKIDFKTNFR